MPPRKQAPGNSQLGISTRARRDPHRKEGNANAVAAGVDLSRVGIMSDRELDWIIRLAYDDDGVAEQTSREAAEARRKALSDARKAGWDDTTEARQRAFLAARAAEEEEAERRKQTLDELYEQQQEEQRLNRIAQLELQHLREDPRGRNLKSTLMLHEAIKAREEQVAFKKFNESNEKAEEQRELQEMAMRHWGEIAEEMRKKLTQRELNMAEKNCNLEMVLYQIDQRRLERKEEKDQRQYVDAEAEDERLENEAEERERLEREAAIGQHNVANSRPALSKRDRLKQRITDGVTEDAELLKEQERGDRIKQAAVDRRRKKEEEFEKRKQVGLDAYIEATAEASPTFRTQDRFEEKGHSFIARMDDGDKERIKHLRDSRMEMNNYREPLNQTTGKPFNKAAATASGFHTREEELANLEEMRKLPALVKAEMEAAIARRKEEDDRVARIQKMQAEEKRERKRREDAAAVDELRRQEEFQAADDARYENYIRAQIPEDMDPFLKEKAAKMS